MHTSTSLEGEERQPMWQFINWTLSTQKKLNKQIESRVVMAHLVLELNLI